MNKTSLFFIILMILVVGGILLYYFYELPKKNAQIDSIIFTLSAQENKKFIKTGYLVYIDNNLYENSTTSDKSFKQLNLPINRSILIYNYNLENQSYYSDIHKFEKLLVGPQRVVFKLIEPAKLNISYVISEDDINLNINSVGIFKNMEFCIKKSNNFIYVNTDFFYINETKWGKCFRGKTLENNDNVNILIQYVVFKDLTPNDYLKIYFLTYEVKPINNEKNEIQKQLYEINF